MQKQPITLNFQKSDFLTTIKEVVQSIDSQAEIILFGSRARGDERSDSDWDVLILIPGKVDLQVEQTFRHQLFNVELEYEQAISTFVYSKSDWNQKYHITPLYHNIQREGIII